MTTTSIEWTTGPDGATGRSWNPTAGCSKISDGCTNCYAESIARRFAGSAAWPDGFEPRVRPDRLDAPLRWRHPRRIFVDSASDLFHDAFPDEYIARVFAVMAAARRHTFLLLTKRHARMRSLLRSDAFAGLLQREREQLSAAGHETGGSWRPLPNLHLGVSVEDQRWADIRIPALLDTPAAVRWISAEPLLGPIDLRSSAPGGPLMPVGPCGSASGTCDDNSCRTSLDWVVTGGESGRGARPCDLEWIRSLRDQCAASGTPIFVKQLGSRWASGVGLGQRKATEPEHWPEDLRVREYPRPVTS